MAIRLVLLLLFVGVAFAQRPEETQEREAIERRFSSSEPWDLAWAARLVGDYGQRSSIPRVIELLSHGDWQVRAAAIDTLIRLRAQVDDEVLVSVAKQHFDLAAILAWQRRRTDLYLRMWDNVDNEYQWGVIVGLLHTVSPPGYAARLLREWKWEVPLIVVEPKQGIGAGISSGVACDGGPPDARYPPVITHRVGLGTPRPGTTLMAAGPHPVSYGWYGCDGYVSVTRSAWTLDYLRDLAKFTKEAPNGYIEFRSAAQYRAEAAAFLKKVHAYLADLRSALIRAGKLGADERAGPAMTIHVNDMRVSKRIPLPQVQGVE